VQRTSADLKLNPHLHSVVLDGVFVAGPDGGDGKPVFHTLPRISDTAVADLRQVSPAQHTDQPPPMIREWLRTKPLRNARNEKSMGSTRRMGQQLTGAAKEVSVT
jgi:hypothetical protein